MTPIGYTEDALIERPAIALLAKLGWETINAYGEFDHGASTLGRETKAEVRWEVSLSGPKATQAQFAPIDVAIGALASKLLQEIGPEDKGSYVLTVKSLDTVDLGSVGWIARLKA